MGQQCVQILLHDQGPRGVKEQSRCWSTWNRARWVRMAQRSSKSYLTGQVTSELLKFHLDYDDKPTWNILCSRMRLSNLCCEKIALGAGEKWY